jgi:hypothetical protein
MTVNVPITPGSGDTVLADQVTDSTLGSVAAKVQYVKLMGGAPGNMNKAGVDSNGYVQVNIMGGLLPAGATTASASGPAVLATDQATISFAQDTTQLMNAKSGVGLPFTKAKISVSTATTTTLVAAQSGKKIRVVSMYLVTASAQTITLQSHTTTSNSDGGLAYAANGGIALAFNPAGWFDTTSGEALDLVTGASGVVGGQLAWVGV